MNKSLNITQKDGWWEFLIIAGIALLITIILLLTTNLMTYDDPYFPRSWDHHKYIHMAEGNPFDFHIAPFCWRIGLPLLVKTLPFPLHWNFLIIAFISVWMIGVVVYYIVKALDYPKVYSFIAMLMFFSLGVATKFVLRSFWMPDALLFLLIALSIYSIITKKDILFILLLIVGVAVKETMIVVIPLYYTLNAHKLIDGKLFRRFVLIILPAVVLLVMLRIFIPQMNNDWNYLNSLPMILRHPHRFSGYSYWQLFKQIGSFRLQSFSWRSLNSYTFGTFGVILLLLPFFSKEGNRTILLKFLPFLLLVYSQIFFAVNTERLLIAAFPLMIILSLNGIVTITKNFSLKPEYFLILPLLMLVLNLTEPMDLSGRFWYQLILFGLFLLLIYLIGQRKKKTNAYPPIDKDYEN